MLAVVSGVLAFGYRYLSYSGFPNDHFVHLATAQQILLGALPVRDYVERGIPLMSVTSALAQRMLGGGLQAEVLLVAAAFGTAAAMTFLVAAQVGRSILAGLLAATATVFVHPASDSYPKLFVYAAALLAGLRYASAPGRGRLLVLAACVVAAFLFRHDHGVIVGAGSAVLLLALHGPSPAGLRLAARFVALAVVLTLPYLAWVEAYQGLGAYVADGVAFSRREAERSARFDVPAFGIDRTRPLVHARGGWPVVNVRWSAAATESGIAQREREHRLVRLDPVGQLTWQYELHRWSSPALERLVRDPAVADTHGIDRSAFRLTDADPGVINGLFIGMPVAGEGLRVRENALGAMYYLAWGVPLLALAGVAARWGRLPEPVRAVVLMAVAVQLAMNATMLRDPLDLRIRDVIVPLAVTLAFLTALPASGAGRVLRWTGRLAAAVLLVVVVGLSAVLGPAGEHLAETGVLDGWRGVARRRAELRTEFLPPAGRTGAISDSSRQVVEYVVECTPPQARLWVLTFAPELFYYTGRGFAGGQVTLTPGYYATDEHAALMVDRLRREDVPLVVLDSETEREVRDGYPRLAAYLEEKYRQVGSFPVSGDKRLIVLADAGRTPARVFGEARLPCFAAAGAAA